MSLSSLLAKEIPREELASETGLTPKQAHHFLEGLKGKHEHPLVLPREQYTILQRTLERLVITELISMSTEVRPEILFVFNTPTPPTPSKDPDHVRYEEIRTQAAYDWILLICGLPSSDQGEYFKRGQKTHFKNFLSDMNPDQISFTETGLHSRLSVDLSSLGYTSIAFFADQLPSEDKGTIYFGNVAHEANQEDLLIHENNLKAGRDIRALKKVLKIK